MPICKCGEELKRLGNPAHLKGALHRCNMTRIEVERRGLTDCAPLSFTRGAMEPVLKRLDAENVVDFYYEYRKGGPGRAHTEQSRYNTTQRLAVAVLRYGSYDWLTLQTRRNNWRAVLLPTALSFYERTLVATLLMQSLYGDDATEVFWRFALAPTDEEQGIVRAVIAANGAPFTDTEWNEFTGSFCLEALILAESARLKQSDAPLAAAA